jgi:hypothetical protein
MPKARLTTMIERESVLSNWYDLSRGFTAALAVTLYSGAVSQCPLIDYTSRCAHQKVWPVQSVTAVSTCIIVTYILLFFLLSSPTELFTHSSLH